MIAVGLALIAVAAAIGYAGIALWNFWIALVLLGVGWNFGFIGATNLVAECHGAQERNKVQAFNDFLIFGFMAVGSLSSGALLSSFGWAAVNALALPVVLGAALLLAWATFVRRAQTV
jgi:MFS family permease